MNTSNLSVGVGRADITAPVGIAHGEWGAQTHSRASGVDLELWATALAISDGETSMVLVDLDLGVLSADDATDARRRVSEATDLPVSNIRISYTHTHSGPTWSKPAENGVHKPGEELVPAYRATVFNQIVGAVRAAVLSAKPCRMAAGYGSSDIGVNRRLRTPEGRFVVGQNVGGYSDPTVLVVRFDDLDEKPVASIVGYGAHPIILAFQNSLISPDYPGVTKRVVEKMTGAPCLFLQGCAGDQMTIEGLTGDTAVPRKMGAILGAEAVRVMLSLRTRNVTPRWDGVVESGAPLGMWGEEFGPDEAIELTVATKMLRMPTRELRPADEARAEADALIAEAVRLAKSDSSAPEERAEANYKAKRSWMWAHWSEWTGGNDYLETELHGTRLGPVGLIGFPGEPFAEIGFDVRTKSPLPFTQLAGYSNGWLGYVPTPPAYDEGGYEVEWATAYTPAAAGVLRESADALLHEIAGLQKAD